MSTPYSSPLYPPCLISVVVPTFNARGHLGRCLESLRAQTFRNFELIIVDGGSTDGTVGMIEAEAKNFPHLVWKSEKDRGVYDAMNKGVALAKGDWLLFLGSDDALYAEDVLAKIAEHLTPAYNFVYGNILMASAASWCPAGVVYAGEFSEKKMLVDNISHQSIFYARALFARYGAYDLSFKVLGDWEFNLRVFRAAKKKYVDMIVARFEGGGLSSAVVDHEFILRFPEIVDRAFRLPFRSAFYKEKRHTLLDLAKFHWRRHKPSLGFRFLSIWLANATAGEIFHQARSIFRVRRSL